jgi:hypothetical protein
MTGGALGCLRAGTTRLLPVFGDVFLAEEMLEYFWHTKYQNVKMPVFSLILRDSLS